MFDEVIRIGGGKPLELDLVMSASMGILEPEHHEQKDLYMYVKEKAALLLDHPNICVHFWNPTSTWRDRDTGPFSRPQVRRRRRR